MRAGKGERKDRAKERENEIQKEIVVYKYIHGIYVDPPPSSRCQLIFNYTLNLTFDYNIYI